ncbi:hypothetical protein Ahy_A01g001490 isoform F [Arachis hypogaea]|uniref:Uncharacterized protein n=1 Tax=Arachis hypogaea TaxID=3818 RepID=A0A445ENP3_ARAHY|nr:hypothetical protein Ahy_A01g001490 isoform F [Arachis hypogaea]
MTITYIIGSYSASRVPRNKLELHVNLAKEILVLGLEPRTRGFVNGAMELWKELKEQARCNGEYL